MDNTKTVQVKGCDTCPMVVTHGSRLYFSCNHPSRIGDCWSASTNKLFATCPLKKKALTIVLESNNPIPDKDVSVYGC